MKSTIWDVAREAGVSISSVSNALNGKKKVSDETLKKIDAAVKKLGYIADPAASSLKTKSSHVIGLIVPSIDSVFFPAVISGLQTVLEKNGYIINFYSTGFNKNIEEKYLKTLLSNRADGIILDSVSKDAKFLSSLSKLELGKKRIPVVALERDLTPLGLTSVFADNYRGGVMAAEHLASRGVTRPAHLLGLEAAPWSFERFEGFKAGLAGAGIIFDPTLLGHGDFSIDGGRAAVRKLLSDGRDFNGIFASNDLSAIGAMQALSEFGCKVPEDVMIVGFDNTYVTSLTTPAITTINVPKQRLGEEAGNAIIRAIETNCDTEKIELPLTLITRQSSRGQ